MKFAIGQRVRVKDDKRLWVARNFEKYPQYRESYEFYGPDGYYQEFGRIRSHWFDSGYEGYTVTFENPGPRQTREANLLEDEIEAA